jgi:integrase
MFAFTCNKKHSKTNSKHCSRQKYARFLPFVTATLCKPTKATLSSILRVAKAWDYACGGFTLADITMPREGVKKEQRCFTDEEVGKIIAAAPRPFDTIMAVTSVLGLRIGEVLALRVSDLDFMRKIIRVRQSVDAATRNVQAVKSQASVGAGRGN